MGGLQSVGNVFKTGIAKASNGTSWVGRKFNEIPETALAVGTVSSIILKDGIGCAMYVTQSLNNDKIPEKKRKFVAALDLTNGVLMIGAQIAMFFAMRKYSGPMFKALFKKSFNPQTRANIISKIRMEQMEKNGKTSAKQVFNRAFDKVEDEGAGLFKFVLDIAAATILGKRVIVPLVATPLAKKVEKKMEKHHGADDVKHHDETHKADENKAPEKVEKTEMTEKTAGKTEDKQVVSTGTKLDIVSTGNNTTNLLDKAKVSQNK